MSSDDIEIELDELSWKDKLAQFKVPLILCISGLVILLFGIRLLYFSQSGNREEVEFSQESTSSGVLAVTVTVDIAGAVAKPGVYTLAVDSRIQDLLTKAGGLARDADKTWIAKHINLATKLVDGTKVYIPNSNENYQTQTIQTLGVVSDVDHLISLNTATSSELDSLPGIGPTTAQKIITNRPYQTIEELLSKKVVSKSVFEKIKEKISVY